MSWCHFVNWFLQRPELCASERSRVGYCYIRNYGIGNSFQKHENWLLELLNIRNRGVGFTPLLFSLMFLYECSKFLVELCITWLTVKAVWATCISNLRRHKITVNNASLANSTQRTESESAVVRKSSFFTGTI